MGFIPTSTTKKIVAKFTPRGLEWLFSPNRDNNLTFTIGDSDRNYQAPDIINGKVPIIGGILDDFNNRNSTTSTKSIIKFKLPVGSGSNQYKKIETKDINVYSEDIKLPYTTISGSSSEIINRTISTGTTNQFKSFNLPITESEKLMYTTPISKGGFSNTPFSGYNRNDVLVISIPKDKFGSQIDGKTIRLEIGSYKIYGTYQSNTGRDTDLDYKTAEDTFSSKKIGEPIIHLFADSGTTVYWGLGYGMNKPFSIGNKPKYNIQTRNSQLVSHSCGIGYLDSGFIVITDPDIISSWSGSSSITELKFDSFYTKTTQSFLCIKNKNEFYKSLNPTYSGGAVTPTEVGIYDSNKNLLIKGKLNESISLTKNIFTAFELEVTL